MRRIDLTGCRIGTFTVIRQVPEREKNSAVPWLCRCDCGLEKEVWSTSLRRRFQGKCSCSSKVEHPLYRTWLSMRSRCNNPHDDSYYGYGARGITICNRWDDFNLFVADMGPKPSKAHSIERKDNNKGYCPENCVWATAFEQNRNKRTNRYLTHNGKTLVMAEWARELGISPQAMHQRLTNGSTGDALFKTGKQR